MKIGDKLPNITVNATGEKTVNLSKLKGKPLVVYFYPKNSTPGCTTEGQNFRDLYEEFQANDCQVYGVSRDSIKSHENFKAKQSFPFDLLSDPEEALCKAFDVIQLKKLYGKEYLGIVRSTFLFDKKGQLVEQWTKVRVKGHVDQVLTAVAKL
jgi:thioredoxin-dependent peroxiredoxin